MQSQIFGWSNLKTFWVISAAFCAHLFLTFLLSIKYCLFDGAKPYNCVSLFQEKSLLLLAYESIETTQSNLKENTWELPLQYAVTCLRCVHEQRRGGGTCTKTPPVIPSPITCVTALALVIRRHASGCPIRAPFQGNFLSRTHLGSRVVNPIYIYFSVQMNEMIICDPF